MSNKTKIWMNQAMHYMMLSCEKATFYIVKSDYQKLSCKENLQLRAHLMGCKFCRTFKTQDQVIADQLRMMQENPPPVKLSSEKKDEIARMLKDQ